MTNQFSCPGCGYNLLFCCVNEWIEKPNQRGRIFTVICPRCRRIVEADGRDKVGTQKPEKGEKMTECEECSVKIGELHEEQCSNYGRRLERQTDNIRTFSSGATRHTDDKKYDYEGFLSPWALRRYGEYMHDHRIQADGTKRDSDNWQKGIPRDQYMKSFYRHALDAWSIHRGLATFDTKNGSEINIEDALCGALFNAFGLLHEILRRRDYK